MSKEDISRLVRQRVMFRAWFVACTVLGALVATPGASATTPAATLISGGSRLSEIVATSEDGNVVAYAGSSGRWEAVTDLTTGVTRRFSHGSSGGGDNPVGLSRDGRTLVSNRGGRAGVVVRDLATKRTRYVRGYILTTASPVLSADGRLLAAVRVTQEGTYAQGVLDLRSRRFVRVPKPPNKYQAAGVRALSGDGKWALTLDQSYSRGRWYLYSLRSRKARFIGYGGQDSPALSDDGGVAILPSQTARGYLVYERRTRTRSTVPSSDEPGHGLTITGDGQTSALTCRGVIYTYSRTDRMYARVASGLPVWRSGSGDILGTDLRLLQLAPKGGFVFFTTSLRKGQEERLYRVPTSASVPVGMANPCAPTAPLSPFTPRT